MRMNGLASIAPEEVVIKETGRWSSVTYVKGAMTNSRGALILTNRRLVFTPGKWQPTDATILILGRLVSNPETVQIPLRAITRVEKGFGEHIDVYADKKYDFRGMRGAGDWVAAIEQARSGAGAYASPIVAPKTGVASAGVCSSCRQPIRPQDRFCSSCGAVIEATPRACQRCGAEIDPSMRFCSSCGTPLM